MADFFSNYGVVLIEVAIAIAAAFLIIVIAQLVEGYWSTYTAKVTSKRQFDELFEDEMSDIEIKKNKNDLWRRWNRYWEKRLIDSGANFMAANRDNAGKIIIYIDLALLAVLTLVFAGSIIGALLVVIGLDIIASFILGMMANKKIERLSGQVPAFLSAMRAANEAANNTTSSLLSAIATTPDELHEELAPVEHQLREGGSLKTVLMSFYETTSVDELRFLMACIVLVNESGKDINEQLGIIQDIVDARMEVERHLKQAIAQVMPTIYVATALIPFMFLYTYITQPIAKQFWFHSIMSWIVFLVVVGIYALGIWFAKHQVDNIRKL